MITEYELYSDERYQDSRYLLLGGIACTRERRMKLQRELDNVRIQFNLRAEMRWSKVSNGYLEAYRKWVDVFFEDPYSRFSMLKVDFAHPDWKSFIPQAGRKPTRDDKFASVFYQFLIVSFGPLRDTKRWWVYPDSGFFSRDKVLDRVEFLFNHTYKAAFGPNSSRIIRVARAQDSKREDMVQLADVLLGAISCDVMGYVPMATARRALVQHCHDRHHAAPTTKRGLEKISVNDWQVPDKFAYPR